MGVNSPGCRRAVGGPYESSDARFGNWPGSWPNRAEPPKHDWADRDAARGTCRRDVANDVLTRDPHGDIGDVRRKPYPANCENPDAHTIENHRQLTAQPSER